MFEEFTVLLVDDDNFNLMIMQAMLEETNATILTARNGEQALEQLTTNPQVDIMLLDLQMPVMDGFEVLRQVRQNIRLTTLPVIVVTADQQEVTRVLAMGASDFLPKPFNPDEMRLRVMNHVRTKRYQDLISNMNAVLEQKVAEKTTALREALALSQEAEYEICLRLGRAAEFRDMETGMHTRRISEMSKELALLAGLSEEQAEVLRLASPLHDVGKIGIPDRILLKPGKLDDAEMQIMKLHTTIGGRILSEGERFSALDAGKLVALQHHEKWDGSGYPNGLKGEEIHIFARIVMVADIFDALASDRPYKKAFPLEQIVTIMEEGRDQFFDPCLLQLFFDHLQRFVAIREQLKDQQQEADPLLELLSVT